MTDRKKLPEGTSLEDIYMLGMVLEEFRFVRYGDRSFGSCPQFLKSAYDDKFSALFSEIEEMIGSSRAKELKKVAIYILKQNYLLHPFLVRFTEMLLG